VWPNSLFAPSRLFPPWLLENPHPSTFKKSNRNKAAFLVVAFKFMLALIVYHKFAAHGTWDILVLQDFDG
jgi:hypothetical protein